MASFSPDSRDLAQIASDCHTPEDQMHRPARGMEFAGGKRVEGFPARSANLTPDPSGISYYDEELFLRVMRTGRVGARALNPQMPWWVFRNMSDDDLKSIFAYLRTVKPIRNRIDNSESASRQNDRARRIQRPRIPSNWQDAGSLRGHPAVPGRTLVDS